MSEVSKEEPAVLDENHIWGEAVMSQERKAVLPNLVADFISCALEVRRNSAPKEKQWRRTQLGVEADGLAIVLARSAENGEIGTREELAWLGCCACLLARLIPSPMMWAEAMENIGGYVQKYTVGYLLRSMADGDSELLQIAAWAALCFMRGFRPIEVIAESHAKLRAQKAGKDEAEKQATSART